METIDLRRMHLLFRDSARRLAVRGIILIVVGAVASGWIHPALLRAGFAIAALVLASLVGLYAVVRPMIATADGLEVGGSFFPWTSVTAPSWSVLTRLRREYLGYHLAFAWVRIGWRPLLMVGESAWIRGVERMRSAQCRTRELHAYR